MRSTPCRALLTVHPRVGGEHPVTCSVKCRVYGSSPRGRGTLPRSRRHAARVRFIPAWAGNTCAACFIARSHSVHPRVGGEHLLSFLNSFDVIGSSPRGRGTLWLCDPKLLDERFIPAWAGNTRSARRRVLCQSVHPRVGGEHIASRFDFRIQFGSSPRGRGTQSAAFRPMARNRFIPAWAGNTSQLASCGSPRSVHPRVGGEHVRFSLNPSFSIGSSPRGRGTRASTGPCAVQERFIPAWAGNTATM